MTETYPILQSKFYDILAPTRTGNECYNLPIILLKATLECLLFVLTTYRFPRPIPIMYVCFFAPLCCFCTLFFATRGWLQIIWTGPKLCC